MRVPPSRPGRTAAAAAAAAAAVATVAVWAAVAAAAAAVAVPAVPPPAWPAGHRWGAAAAATAAAAAAAATADITAAVRVIAGGHVDATARFFPFSAVDASYVATPTVTVDPTCPQAVTIGGDGLVVGDIDVLFLPVANISQGAAAAAVQCAGGTMRVVRLAAVLNAGAMAAANLTRMVTDLNASVPAASMARSLNASTADALVGWDGVPRQCGGTTYPAGTFYFFVVADEVIELEVGGESRGTIPTNQQAMIIAPGDARICALVAAKQIASPSPSPSPAPSVPPTAAPTPPPTPVASPSGAPEPTEDPFPTGDPTDPAVTDDPAGSIEPTASPADAPVAAPDDGSACFPAAATLRRADGGVVTMGALRVGDDVAVGGGASSRVYLFSHADAAAVSSMVTLTTAAAGTLTASADHLVYVASRGGGGRTAVAADTVSVGDVLVADAADAAAATVTSVGRVRAAGLYAPHTHTGDLLVDGFVVSSYTRLLPRAVAHAALAPVRAAAAAGVLPGRLARSGLWAGGRTPRRAAEAALAAVRAAVVGVAGKSEL